MKDSLVYISYLVAVLVAACIYVGLPKEGRDGKRGGFVVALALAAGAMVYLFQRMSGTAAGQVTFWVLAILGVGAAVRVVTHPRPVYSALYFVFVVLATAALLIQVGAEFLGIALVIVYAGAILVTYVFVIMLSQQSAEARGNLASVLDFDRSAREPVWASIAGFMLMATLAGMIVEHRWEPNLKAIDAMSGRNTVELGRLLMTEFAVSVELAAVLLMVALVGAIAVARKRLPQAAVMEERLAPGEIGKQVPPF